jgi:polyphosphate glucokinase
MKRGKLTLSIDIGATGLKAGVVDTGGDLVTEHARVLTPRKGTPDQVVAALLTLIEPLGAFDRVSVGFPGVVRAGHVMTAPNLDTKAWRDFPLTTVLTDRLGKPVRMLNDATVHGLGVIKSTGLECVIALGTGFGFALFDSGHLTPHLEVSHHPIRTGKDYDQYIGNVALHDIGRKRWNKRVAFALTCVKNLTGYDTLYVGGGNARLIKLKLDENIHIVPNDAALIGGVRLWDAQLDPAFSMGASL